MKCYKWESPKIKNFICYTWESPPLRSTPGSYSWKTEPIVT
nr:MAG TPA: hypothetical protein [Bacteriophage sp.]